MSENPTVFGAFAGVDQMPDPAMLIRAMDETGEWDAIKFLRSQAREWLGLNEGDAILDVGCGPGTAVLALASDVGPNGRIAGIDASSAMIAEATRRAAAEGTVADFRLGDAEKLDFPDDTFDACRSERTLQWLDNPEEGLAELVRVTRPGRTVVVIDTDWGTFAPYHPDVATTELVKTTMMSQRPGFFVGRQLRSMFVRAGLDDVRVVPGTHVITHWDPSARPSPPGLPPLAMLVSALTLTGSLSQNEAEAWVDQLAQTARDGQFFASLTMFAVAGRKPL